MRVWSIAATASVMLVGCGDNIPGIGEPLAPAKTLFVIAHFDDDMIFMEPEIVNAIESRSSTTVYVTSGDPLHGNDSAEDTFFAAQVAYAAVAGSKEWKCGYKTVAGAPVHHCRLRDRGVSMIGLDIPDGGIEATNNPTLLQLVEQQVTTLPIMGPVGGVATETSIVDELAEIIATTNPTEIHTLDLAATHGRDHSSHLFASAFTLWAAARVGYAGPMRWHRGYNVETEQPDLDDASYAAAASMIGYFEACYFGCGPCGSSCTKLDSSHDTWVHRQYSTARVTATSGSLSLDGSAVCLAMGGSAALADCAVATPLTLDAAGHLSTGDACVAAAADGSVSLAPCGNDVGQYWVLDEDGLVWNGEIPPGTPGMDFDHVRCLVAADPVVGGAVTTATCGAATHPHWQFVPSM